MFTRIGALIALGVGGMFALMPHPGANETVLDASRSNLSDPMRLLLSPAPLSSERFLAYYAIAYR